MSLRKKAIAGLFWTFTQQFGTQAINVLVGILLARMLAPSTFGLIGMLSVFIAVGNALIDSGMTSSLIRTQDADQNDYSTVFYINILFSVILYFILFGFSPSISNFYNQPILSNIIRVYSLTFIINALVGVQTTKLTKEMRFKEQMFMQLPSTFIGGILGLVLAYNGFGVWSLVFMNLAQSLLFMLQHWLFAGWMPSFRIDLQKLKFHFYFGYKLTFSGVIDAIYSNIYTVVIGKYFTPKELGFYSQAKSLQMLPVKNISTALTKVSYPMFASIKDDPNNLKNAYRKLLHQVIFWVAPLMVLGIVVAKPLFVFALTEKWLPSVPYFQLLCLTGILYPFHSYNLNILNVRGRSDLFLRLEVIKKIFISVGILCSLPFGIYGLLLFQIIASIFSFWVNTYFSGRFIDYSGMEQIREVVPIIFIAFFVGIFTYFLNVYLLVQMNLPTFLVLILLIVLYVFQYVIFCKIFRIQAYTDFKQILYTR